MDTEAGLLTAEQVDAGYGSHLVVKQATITVAPGGVACLLGPNGAGKSTLLKAIAGIVRCFGGVIRLGEIDITNRRTEALARMGLAFVPQMDDVFEPLSVRENLEMGGFLLSPSELRRRLQAVLGEFPRLAPLERRNAGSLSGGERKLLAIARALMVESRFLLLDEPTAGLSPSVASSVLGDVVANARRNGTGILLVEQRARVALEVSDDAYVLVGGVVRAAQPAAEMLQRSDLGDLLIGAATTGSGHQAVEGALA
jgi:ABC-type branched-subunit amino acid transport system ATPase component